MIQNKRSDGNAALGLYASADFQDRGGRLEFRSNGNELRLINDGDSDGVLTFFTRDNAGTRNRMIIQGGPNTSFLRFGADAINNEPSAMMEFAGWGILHGGLRFVPKDTRDNNGKFIFSMGGNDNPVNQMDLFAIQQNGNVGIGTTAPGAYKLNVNGKTYLGGNSTLLAGSDSWGEGLNIDSPPDIWGGIKWRRTNRSGSTGNWHLGYMANDGDNKLYLWEGNDSKAVATFEHNGTVAIPGKVNVGTLCFGVSCLNKPSDIYQWGVNGNDIYYTGGNVGIGTETPKAKLEIAGGVGINTSGNAPQGKLEVVNANTYGAYFTTSANGNGMALGGNSTGGLLSTNQAVPMLIGINGTEKVRVDTSGNVGIGTTDPGAYKLNVNGKTYLGGNSTLLSGSDSWGEGLNIDSPPDVWGGIKWRRTNRSGSTGNWHLGYMANDGDNRLYLWEGNDSKAVTTFQHNGNVGIGTTSPGEKLDVAGSIRAINGPIYTQSPGGYAQTSLQQWGLNSPGTMYLEPGPGTILWITDQWAGTGSIRTVADHFSIGPDSNTENVELYKTGAVKIGASGGGPNTKLSVGRSDGGKLACFFRQCIRVF